MESILKFLNFINDNWTTIVTIIGVALLLYKKIKSYIALSNDKKISLALEQVRLVILKLVTDAETEYGGGTGKIKRSEVISKIFEKYPILKKATSIDDLTKKIDSLIDESLTSLRNILSSNEKFSEAIGYNSNKEVKVNE